MRAALKAAVVLLVVVAVAIGVGAAFHFGVGPLPDRKGCTATAQGREVFLDPEQSQNAALIAAVATRRGLPARAVSIALATAIQESKLYNLGHGDRDSLGLFQQRPSQGWGTEEEILDPHHAINAFYDALVEVDGYRTMPINDAAQTVQRSGYPEAYADHEDDGRTLASALTGYSAASFTCVVRGHDLEEEREGPSGLTSRAQAMLKDAEKAFGDLPTGGYAPRGVSTGHMRGSAHYDGRAVDFFERPISPQNKRHGWALASYLVANAERLGIKTVIFDDRIWTAGIRSESGWRDYDIPGSSSGDRAVLEHRDHVHADVV